MGIKSKESPNLLKTRDNNDSTFWDEQIFQSFVKWENETDCDILGMIAFGFYKRQKIEFLENYLVNKDRYPTEDEIRVFYNSINHTFIQTLRRNAERVLLSYGEAIIDIERRKLEKETIRKVSTFKSIVTGALGSVLYTFILILALLFAKFGNIDIIGYIQSLLNAK